MIAICPAGPPKLMNPSLSQNRNASEKETGSGGAVAGLLPISSGACGVVDIEKLDQLAGFVHEAVVVFDQLPRTPQQGFKAGCLGHRYTAGIEIMDDGADALEGRIALQSETGKQHLEGHLCPYMGELCPVEIVAYRAPGTFFRAFQPQKLRPWINETFDQPGAGQAIGPWAGASRPGPALALSTIAAPNLPGR